MSTDTFYSIAQADTPETVTVPKSWTALAVWAVGRFGVGVIVAAVFWHAWREERRETHVMNDRIIGILESRARLDSEMTTALTQLRSAIDEMRRDAGLAHRQSSK